VTCLWISWSTILILTLPVAEPRLCEAIFEFLRLFGREEFLEGDYEALG
jgi:hypothetical protein